MDHDRAMEIVRGIRDETLEAAISILKEHGENIAAQLIESARIGFRWGWLLDEDNTPPGASTSPESEDAPTRKDGEPGGDSWIQCKEQLPKKEKLYQVWVPGHQYPLSSFFHLEDTNKWDAGWDFESEPTHWRELPQPPPAAEE